MQARGKRTTTQIECPDIIKIFLFDLATEDEEIGTNQSHGMVVTTAGPVTIDHDAGPISRYWNARSSDQLERVIASKDQTCRGGEDEASHHGPDFAHPHPPSIRPKPKSECW